MADQKIRVKIDSEVDAAYVYLPGFPERPQQGIVKRTITLDEVVADFKGPMVNLDFNEDGLLIGIEILA